MINLLPRDNWEYSLVDLVHGLAASAGRREQPEKIHIAQLGGCIPVNSGRAGLVAAIKALDLPPGACVGVPLYCCPIVFSAISSAGCTMRFIDIEPDTFCMSPQDLTRKRQGIDAVIAVHMFGNICDIGKLREVIRDIPIIEDCAQALGSKIGARMAGSLGTVSFFSFRSGKYLSAGEGGALFTDDPRIESRIIELIGDMPVPTRVEEFSHIVKIYIKSKLRRKPLYGLVGHLLWDVYNRKFSSEDNSDILLMQIHLADLKLIKKRLFFLNEYIDKQRSNAEIYSTVMELDPAMLCTEKPGTFYNRCYFPITFSSREQRDFMATHLLGRGIDTMKFIDDVVKVAERHYGYRGGCPVSEQLSKSVLVIPNYHTLGKTDVQRVADIVSQGWKDSSKSAS
jgi:dTDP-4-amino-4,6-dideoxygalactose transaminase